MNDNTNWIDGLKRAVTADPKRSGALAVLAAVFAVLLGRTILSGDGKASLKSAAASTVSPAQKKVEASNAVKNLNAALAVAQQQRAAGMSSDMHKWASGPVPPVSRNLFAVRIDYFPLDDSRTTRSNAEDEVFWDRLGKSLSVQADQKDRQENLRANFMAQASKLRLESTMPGPQPKAMLNGELVGEGSVVADFRVLKIEARRIIIEREGIRLEIQMK